MRTIKQRLIEQDLKQGKTIINKGNNDKYVEAIFYVSQKGGSGYDKKALISQESALAKEYKFRIDKDKLGNVIDHIRSLPGVTMQTKNQSEMGQGTGKETHSFPEIK